MELSHLFNIQISNEHLNNVINNNEYNKTIISYYERLFSQYPQVNFSSQIENLSNCNSWWLLDYYKEQKVKDFKKTNLCKDKFCNNCKKVKQASRLAKFMPIIDEMSKDKHLYHLVLTVPNCQGTNLKDVIQKIFKSFYAINRYLKLEKKIKGYDFSQYGYSGAIRSLEVTFSKKDYHPHLHCVISLDNALDNNRNIVNTYSKSKKNGYRKFTEFEILIQKIWYLLFNGERVNQKSIQNLEIGYSCTIDPIDESSVYEVFKYMTKSTDDKNNILTYQNFKDLYFALYRVRQIQGYGCFYNIKDDDSIIDEVDYFYNKFLEELQQKENPVEISQSPQDLLLDNENIIISRKKIFKYLRDL